MMIGVQITVHHAAMGARLARAAMQACRKARVTTRARVLGQHERKGTRAVEVRNVLLRPRSALNSFEGSNQTSADQLRTRSTPFIPIHEILPALEAHGIYKSVVPAEYSMACPLP